MKIYKDMLWTWLLPDVERGIDKKEWIRHGGKWIIFDKKGRITRLAEKLEPFIDSGEIKSAKYWNKDPSAINVYSLDNDKERVWEILKSLGAGESRCGNTIMHGIKMSQTPQLFFIHGFRNSGRYCRAMGL